MFLSVAKQEAFEESLRFKRQFRALEDDEVDFLDSVLESTRAKEQQVKKETAEQLDAFRKQREAVEREISGRSAAGDLSNLDTQPLVSEESWAASSRKRRRVKERGDQEKPRFCKVSSASADFAQPKLSSNSGTPHPATSGQGNVQNASTDGSGGSIGTAKSRPEQVHFPRTSVLSPKTSPPALGLGAYSSDED